MSGRAFFNGVSLSLSRSFVKKRHALTLENYVQYAVRCDFNFLCTKPETLLFHIWNWPFLLGIEVKEI